MSAAQAVAPAGVAGEAPHVGRRATDRVWDLPAYAPLSPFMRRASDHIGRGTGSAR